MLTSASDSSAIWEELSRRARLTPLAPAIMAPGRKDMTYGILREQIRETIENLNGLGLGRDDRIALALPQGPESPAALVSVMSGCVCIPLNPESSVAEMTASLGNARAAALVTRSAELPNAVVAAQRCGIPIVELEPLPTQEAGRFTLHAQPSARRVKSGFSASSDLAVIFSTSGTTSAPKLIPLTHAVVCERAKRARHCVDLSPSDRCLDFIPSFQGGAIRVSILGSLFAGASSDYRAGTAPADFDRCLTETRPTWCALPPPFLEMLLSEDFDRLEHAPYPGLRAFLTTGAPVSAETIEAIERKFGVPLQNYYGSAECGGLAVNPLPPRLRKRGSLGLGFGPEIVILDEHGQPAKPEETGEIAVRGSGLFSGYEIAGSSDLKMPPLVHGWYRTGDRGHIDSDGYIFLTGRLGDAINRGGEKIFPEEIEEVLRSHPSVEDAVVFSIPHDVLGQEAAALVVPVRGSLPNPNELRRFVAGRAAAFKIPRIILAVENIPVGPAGKVQRNQLASQYAEPIAQARRDRDTAYHTPQTRLEWMLSTIWSNLLKVDRIGIREGFVDLGGDSLLAVNMLSEVERRFGRTISHGAFWQSPTIETLAALILDADHKKCPVQFPIQRTGSKPPLFCVLPGWYVPEAELLSRYLGPEQPVYALIPDPRPGAGQGGFSREEIVAECVAAMQEVQGDGPYHVIGRSVGGLVAFEIAQHLRRGGKQVALIGLVDSHYPQSGRANAMPAFLRAIEFLVYRLSDIPPSQWGGRAARFPRRMAGKLWRKVRGRRSPSEIADLALYTGLQNVFHEEPAPWPGRIVFFAAEASRHRSFADSRWLWAKVAEKGMEVHLIPGNHNMLVQEPNVRDFAASLKGCLSRAQDAADER